MPFGRFGMLAVTFVQLRPPSRDTWTLPSSVPTHSTFGRFVDSAKEMIVGHAWMPSFFAIVTSLPFTPIVTTSSRLVLVVRSVPSTSQVRPRFDERYNLLAPA